MISVTELFYNSFSTAMGSGLEANDTHTRIDALQLRHHNLNIFFTV